MLNQNNSTITANTEKSSRPTLKSSRKISYTNTVFTLAENKMYGGEIIDSSIFGKNGEDRWAIKIRLDDRNIIFCNVNKLPLFEYSPLNSLLAGIR